MPKAFNKILITLAIIGLLTSLTSCASKPLIDDCSNKDIKQECVKNKKKGGDNDDMERMD